MEKRELESGDVVQINPEGKYKDHFAAGMLLVVTEPKSFGCQGYLMSATNFEACKLKGVAYLRISFEDMEYVGKLTWERFDSELE